MVLRGEADHTAQRARALVAGLPPDDVLWLHERSDALERLGRSWDVVVLDLHSGFDPELLAAAQGFVRGGGGLVLRLPVGAPPVREGLVVHPYRPDQVGQRTWARLQARLSDGQERSFEAAPRVEGGSPRQDEVVRALRRAWARAEPSRVAVLADRGRGKSAALGLALAGLEGGPRVALTAASPDAVGEVLRFAGSIPFVEPLELAHGSRRWDLVVVDEAARLPVPLLRSIHLRQAHAHQVWATTTGGYEGTGRGFELRFLSWLAERGPVERLGLTTPIRWCEGDPLEALVRDVLLLDPSPPDDPDPSTDVAIRSVAHDDLANDERLLRAVYGLLVHAHPRTTPGDLERLLDAPNLELHAAFAGGDLAGVCWVAREGGLPEALCDELVAGRTRIRGHALPDTLISHLGRAEAGRWSMVRSVRIAVHPSVRRRGVGRRLVDHVHATYRPELFGTVFGATPELLRFRQELGYQLVRVGVSRGSRTGEPAAVMLRPGTERASAWLTGLREDLARDLPVQLELLAADGDLAPSAELRAGLMQGLGPVCPLTDDAVRAAISGYTHGPRPFDAVVVAVRTLLERQPAALGRLDADARRLVLGRAVEGRSWNALARDGGFQSIPAVMRALRRAVRLL